MSAKHRKKASKELLDLLNKAISRELQVVTQYMWQHIQWIGIKGFSVKDQLRIIAMNEMTHAEFIAERLNYLGGTPTTKPDPIAVGGDIKEMITLDAKAEEGAVALYHKIIQLAAEEDDVVTRKLFEQILEDEEGHLDIFEGWLGDL
ncbi:MAG TPA: ferritin [Proteobacteria bacterium]|nr:bacterioferritin [bacterium BMS3Abin14]HDL53443.1 ferritin [Pseudomonadota bacterium]